MKEIEIKTRLVKYLLDCRSDDDVIGSEVRFNFGTRRADIILLSKEKAIAYEIKGAGDNTERLDYQLKSYKGYFDSCFVVCEPGNLSSVRKSIGQEVGIIVVNDDGGVLQIRRSKLFKRHDKISLASTLSVATLKKLSPKNATAKHNLCIQVCKESSTDYIRSISRNELRTNLYPAFRLFLNDIGEQLNPDDIFILSRMPAIALKKNYSDSARRS